jgi:hypothetical protein
MRNLILLAAALCVASEASATDLRGRVQIRNAYRTDAFAMTGVPVNLYAQKTSKEWVKVGTALTESDGMYYFPSVAPGDYALQVGGVNFQLKVLQQPLQDITPVTIQR